MSLWFLKHFHLKSTANKSTGASFLCVCINYWIHSNKCVTGCLSPSGSKPSESSTVRRAPVECCGCHLARVLPQQWVWFDSWVHSQNYVKPLKVKALAVEELLGAHSTWMSLWEWHVCQRWSLRGYLARAGGCSLGSCVLCPLPEPGPHCSHIAAIVACSAEHSKV